MSVRILIGGRTDLLKVNCWLKLSMAVRHGCTCRSRKAEGQYFVGSITSRRVENATKK